MEFFSWKLTNISLIDNTGNAVVKYKYDAYGNCTGYNSTNTELADINPIRYRSYYFDRDTGLYYLQARYYNPQWRRFISPDSTEYLDIDNVNGLNLYCYCNNDPVNHVDPSGHAGILITLLIATGIGLVAGAGLEIGKQIYNDGDFNWDFQTWNWWEIGASALTGAVTGFAYGLGGVAGGILKGTFKALSIAGKAFSTYQSIALLMGTAATVNFVAGAGAYALNTIGSESNGFNFFKAISKGFGQTGKGMTTFFLGSMFIASGFWNVGSQVTNSIDSIISRSSVKFIMNFIPNYIFDNMF